MATLPMDVAGNEEFLGEIQIESPDYTDYELIDPGYYTSPSRTVTPEQRFDKNNVPFVMARLEMAELLDKEGNTIRLRKPLVKYIFSFNRQERNHKGETSEISKYLKKCGVNLGGVTTVDTLKQALSESAAIPARVRVGWTNRTPKVGEEYLKEKAYTNDFNRGVPGNPSYVPLITTSDLASFTEKAQARLQQVVVDGVIKAKHRVDEFDRV